MKAGTAPLILSAVVFAVYLANVILGAAGQSVLFGDVTEMLILGFASVAFVIGVLQREAHARNEKEEAG